MQFQKPGTQPGVVKRVMVELERRERPISGTVRAGSGSPDRAFVGWIGLLAALEAALDTDVQGGEETVSVDPSV
jgi:hypothetical protein